MHLSVTSCFLLPLAISISVEVDNNESYDESEERTVSEGDRLGVDVVREGGDLLPPHTGRGIRHLHVFTLLQTAT